VVRTERGTLRETFFTVAERERIMPAPWQLPLLFLTGLAAGFVIPSRAAAG